MAEPGITLLPGLLFHHLGYACTSITRERTVFELLGYKQEGSDFSDPIQGVHGCFLVGPGPRIELLENTVGSRTLTPWLDAGTKLFTSDLYTVTGYGHLLDYPEAVVVNLSEEHGVVDLSACRARPAVGDVVDVVPNHCCVVSNMVDEVYGVRNGTVEAVWPVAARGEVR